MAENRLERRVQMLSDAMQARVRTLSESITPEGTPAPFTERLSRSKAMEWWRQHRYDQYGQALTRRMNPQQVMDLDVRLSDQGVPDG